MNETAQQDDKFLRRQQQKRHLAAVWARMAGLAPGMRALDVGSGRFVLASEYAKLVAPGGCVFALEPRYAPEAEIPNLVHLAQDADSPILLPAPDVIFCTDTLHHAAAPATLLAALRKVAGPATVLLVTEYDPAQAGLVGAKPHRRLAPAACLALLEAAGFAPGAPFATEDEHYAILARPR
jgi:predicted methyltransferase